MPLRLSTRGRYGVRLMLALASGASQLRDVALREGISEKYLGQLVLPLKNAGLLTSRRGARGGVALARPPATITVREVVEAIEGRTAAVRCVDDPGSCARAGSCAAARVWRRLSEDIGRSLSSFTLGELARQARRPAEPDYQI